MEKVGFIGLGTMGGPMAWNIKKAGYELGVYNRSQDKTAPFRERGVSVHRTPAVLAENADIIIIMVFGPEALQEVLSGAAGLCCGLRRGSTVINMSTVSREATLAAAAAVQKQKALFLDAPVAGSKKPAQEGTLTILAGGEQELLGRMSPLLKTMGSTIIYCGGVGQGTAMKLFINLLLGTLMQCFAEALSLGRALDLPLPAMLQTVANSALSCPLYTVKGAAISAGDFSKNFSVDLMYKDLGLILDAARSTGVPLPLTAAAREAFGSARDRGFGDEDMCSVIKIIESITAAAVRA